MAKYIAEINGTEVVAVPLCRTYEDEVGVSHYNSAIRFHVGDFQSVWVSDTPTRKKDAEPDAQLTLESLGFTRVEEPTHDS